MLAAALVASLLARTPGVGWGELPFCRSSPCPLSFGAKVLIPGWLVLRWVAVNH